MTTVTSTGNLQNAKPLRSHVTMDRADCPWFSTDVLAPEAPRLSLSLYLNLCSSTKVDSLI